MTRDLLKLGDFYKGALASAGQALLAFSERSLVRRKIEHTFLFLWSNDRIDQASRLDWTATVLLHPGWSGVEYLIVGTKRNAALYGTSLGLRPIDILPAVYRGEIRGGSVVSRSAYLVGTEHAAFRFDGSGRAIDISIPRQLLRHGTDTPGLEAIDGFGPEELYAVGWDGEIWRFDGKNWKRVASPVNSILSSVLCAPDGNVYIVGQRGTLLRGRDDKWEVLDTDPISEDIWSVQWYQEAVFASSMQQLFIVEDNELHSIELPEEVDTFHWLSSTQDHMLSVGGEDVLLLGPDDLTRIV